MTLAIPSVNPMSPNVQFEQVKTALDSILQTLCEKTEEAFHRVNISKTNERGETKSYSVKDPDTGEMHQTSSLPYIVEIKTGNLFLDEEMYILSIKCALLVLALPFYTATLMGWHLIKTAAYVANANPFERRAHLREGVFEVVKAPFFGLGMQLAALYGVIKPLHGRAAVASIENAWQNGVSYKDVQGSEPFYLARCFQVRGNLRDRHIHLTL